MSKGNIKKMAGGIIIVAAIALLFIFPGTIFGLKQNCKITPYDPSCTCNEGFIKLVSKDPRFPGFQFCETLSGTINLNEPGWEPKVQEYCLQQFDTYLPQCDMPNRINECDRLEITWFAATPGRPERVASFECAAEIEPNTFQGLAQCDFFVQNGSFFSIGGNERFWCFDRNLNQHKR